MLKEHELRFWWGGIQRGKDTMTKMWYRKDDIEDKWVATKIGEKLSHKEIKKSVEFLEQYFDSEIKMLE